MNHFSKILLDGGIVAVIASLLLIVPMMINPRFFLQDYPNKIKEAVPARTASEKKAAIIFGTPFILVLFLGPFFSTLSLKATTSSFGVLFLNAFGVSMAFNLVDWLVLDWLLFCTITPKFMVIPGTEGMAAYKDYAFHFRGFITGTVISVIAALVIAMVIFFIK